MKTTSQSQTGAALITALMFLVIITLLSVSAMRSSTVELRMASNEQMRVESMQTAQAAIDTAFTDMNNFPVAGSAGYTICTANVTNCNQTTISLTGAAFGTTGSSNSVKITMQKSDKEGTSPGRAQATSSDKFNIAIFDVASTHSNTGTGESTELVQGVVRLIPKYN